MKGEKKPDALAHETLLLISHVLWLFSFFQLCWSKCRPQSLVLGFPKVSSSQGKVEEFYPRLSNSSSYATALQLAVDSHGTPVFLKVHWIFPWPGMRSWPPLCLTWPSYRASSSLFQLTLLHLSSFLALSPHVLFPGCQRNSVFVLDPTSHHHGLSGLLN